jgi:signal transduction histidine kinase
MALRRFIARRDDESSPSDSPVPLVLALARDVLDVEAALTRLRRFMIIIGAVAPLVLVGILSRLVSIGLKPVDALAGQIGAIDEQRLSTTIEPAGAPTELRPVVVRLNEMLSRLARAFEREKTLTADVAHELRTPLAGLRSTLEVALSRQREPAAYQQAMSESLAICRQTQTLVENLLALARLDVGADRVRHQPAPIDSLLDDAWKPFSQEASSKALKVQWDVEPGLVAHTDPDKLRLVLNNLLENAVHYVDPGGSVAVRASRDNGTTRLRISNSGSRVSPDQVAHVFDRFWRGDVARQSDGVHTGLGLALCKRIVEQLGGQISADSTKNGEFSVNVTFDAGARQQ